MIKAVIFDMDGVLIDSEVEYVNRFTEQFKKCGLTFSKKDASDVVGSSSKRTDEILSKLLEGIMDVQEFWKLWREELENNPIDYMKIRVKNADKVLKELKERGYKIGLASATEYENIVKEMKEAQLYEYFDAISSGHEFEESKPHPAVYLATLQRLGIKKDECIVVEDSKYGIEAGKRAGCYVVGKKVDAFDIDQSRADELIEDLEDVLSVVERMKKA